MSKPKSAKTGAKVLISHKFEFAADPALELKLEELQKSLARDRFKREQIAASRASTGSARQHGHAAVPRGSARAQAAAASPGLVPADGSSGQHYGSRMPGAPQAGQLPFRISPRQDAVSSPPPRASQPVIHPAPHPAAHPASHPPPLQHGLATERSNIASTSHAGASPARPDASSSSHRAVADVLSVHEGSVGGVMGGSEAAELSDGRFDEGDSHRSFLEARSEWLRANGRGASTASARPGSAHTAGAIMEVQTETARPASAGRPASARAFTFFDKLLISEHSRQAADAAEPEGTPRARPASARPPATASAAAASLTAASAAQRAGASGVGGPAGADVQETARSAGQAGSTGDKLAVLARLEELERQQGGGGGAGSDDEDDGAGTQVAVTSAVTGRGLTKGVRLPDNIIVPEAGA